MNKSSDSLDEEVSNILVAIRVRPLLEKERKNDEMPIVRAEDNLIVLFFLKRSFSTQRTRKEITIRSR